MRLAAQVGLAYVIVLVLSAVWRLMPMARSMPDAVALFAVYLGLTARGQLAPSVLAAVVIGYLADLLMGAPHGVLAFDAGLLCVIAHLVHKRLLVRGWVFTMVFTAITALVSGLVLMGLRVYVGAGLESLWREISILATSAVLTGLVGPLVFRMCRRLDARFARTQRDRMVALEGLIP